MVVEVMMADAHVARRGRCSDGRKTPIITECKDRENHGCSV